LFILGIDHLKEMLRIENLNDWSDERVRYAQNKNILHKTILFIYVGFDKVAGNYRDED
jgi:hypothetical protein